MQTGVPELLSIHGKHIVKQSILLLVVTQEWPEAPPAVIWIRGHVTRWSKPEDGHE